MSIFDTDLPFAGPATPETERRRHERETEDERIRRIVREEIARALTPDDGEVG